MPTTASVKSVTEDPPLSGVERLLRRLIANRKPANGRLWLLIWAMAELLTLWSWLAFAANTQKPATDSVALLAIGLVGLSAPFVAYAALRAARADDEGDVSHSAETEALRVARNVMGVVLGVVLYLGSLLGIQELLARSGEPIGVAVTFIGLFGGTAALGLSVALHRRSGHQSA